VMTRRPPPPPPLQVAGKYQLEDNDSTEESPLVLSSPDDDTYIPNVTPTSTRSAKSTPWDPSLGLGQLDDIPLSHATGHSEPFSPAHVPSTAITLNLARSKDLSPTSMRSVVAAIGVESSDILPGTPHLEMKAIEVPQMGGAKPQLPLPRKRLEIVEVRQPEKVHEEDGLLSEGHSEEELERRSVMWRRVRGGTALVGECLGFATALGCVPCMALACIEIEAERHDWDNSRYGDSSPGEQQCREQVDAYRAYYSVGVALAVALTLMGAVVPLFVFRKCSQRRDRKRSLRQILDELGYYQGASDNLLYIICSGIKWTVKCLLLIALGLGYYEGAHDTVFRNGACDSRDVGEDMAWYFGWALLLRCISTGWDLFVKVLPFVIIARFEDLTDQELRFEEMHEGLASSNRTQVVI